MNKTRNAFELFCVLFLTLFFFSCETYMPHLFKHTQVTNSQEYHLPSGINIINYGGFAFPEPFDTVNYYIDEKKVASHNSAASFEKMVQLPPGEHQFIVKNGSIYNCKYSFKIDEGQIGTFNNYNSYSYMRYKADKKDLVSWGFQNVNSQVMEKKVGRTGCETIDSVLKKMCQEYYDNLCR